MQDGHTLHCPALPNGRDEELNLQLGIYDTTYVPVTFKYSLPSSMCALAVRRQFLAAAKNPRYPLTQPSRIQAVNANFTGDGRRF